MTEVTRAAEHIVAAAGQLTQFMYAGQACSWLPADLTLPQLKVLLLAAAERGATGGQMGHVLGVSLPTISGIVDRLAERGLVERHDDPADRRVTRVLATPEGQLVVRRMDQFRVERLAELLAVLAPDDRQAVEHAFDILAAAAQACRLRPGATAAA